MAQKYDAETVFAAAIEIAAPQARAAFLNQACQDDPDLRCEVERLVADYFRAGDFLEQPVVQIAAPEIDPSPVASRDTQIGPYTLLEQLGEGGMGVVYVAEQTQPVRRKVALKIIKPGMDTREVVARFEAERQALALMNHPNIAQVFDAGATAAGRPYFVMELVEGTPITEFCDRHQLAMRERLALFVTLCHGVQHAHQKGVIHRDLKPSNLLVEMHDFRPVPKIIDFGIAKAIGPQLTGQSLHTGLSQMVGTPLYMSPEQAGQSSVDVDTRSDIYSLGVVLYELLTGHRPFEWDTLHTAPADELRRIIREVDPLRPSARVSTLKAVDLSTISDRRQVEPHKLSQQLRGELDWIVMKALEKDRARRYTTANDLAADITRYLHDEPVAACPPSAWYRFTKSARRNRTALLTGALVALALMAGTGVSVWQARRARTAERRAEMRYEQARRAVDEMYAQFAEEWLVQQSELTKVQREFLEKALAFYNQFAAEQGDDPQTQFDAATARFRTAKIQRALGAFDQAEASYKESITQFEELSTQFPDRTDYVAQLSLALAALAHLNSELGKIDQSERLMKQSVAILEESVDHHPEDLELIAHFAMALRMLGHAMIARSPGPAEAYLRRGRDLCQELVAKERDPDDTEQFRLEAARFEQTLASLYLVGDRLPEAAQSVTRAIEHFEKLVAAEPADRELRGFLGGALQTQATVLAGSGRADQALEAYRRAADIFEALAKDFPDRDVRGCLLTAYFNLMTALQSPEEVLQVGRKGMDLGEQLVREFPAVAEYQRDLTIFLLATGHLIRKAEPAQARSQWERAYTIWEKAVADLPDDRSYVDSLARTSAFAAANYATGPPDDPLYNPALALQRAQRSVEVMPDDPYYQLVLGRAQYRVGDFAGCIATIEKVAGREGADYFDDFFVAMAYWRTGNEVLARERFTRAEGSLQAPWDSSWYPDPATARLIRDEAAALLGLTPTAGAPAPAAKEETPK